VEEVVVAGPAGAGLSGGVGDVELAVGVQGEVPAGLVDVVVVVGAQQGGVVQAGGA